MYGGGSDGPLVVTGTTNLALDIKHQFTTVDIQAGGTLRGVGDGAVLYICATESITIAGDIQAYAITTGDNKSITFTVDDTVYTAPGTAAGGKGGDNLLSAIGGSQNNGFGGGGAGGSVSYSAYNAKGGDGGNGGYHGGSGGASVTGDVQAGNNGGVSAGGSGGLVSLSSPRSSGKGGDAYGAAGGDGVSSSGNGAGGGGGSGGRAGVPGVHIVLRSPKIYITGTVSTRILDMSADGRRGGNGGNGAANYGRAGSGGGGGGGANAGNLYLTGSILDYDTATYNMFGGLGGPGGLGYQAGGNGASGADGVLYITNIIPPKPAEPYTGPFYRVWDGIEWQYVSGKVFNESVFKPSKPTIL